jgi:hypothetical protein
MIDFMEMFGLRCFGKSNPDETSQIANFSDHGCDVFTTFPVCIEGGR